MTQAAQPLPHLDVADLAAELRRRPGMIPIEIDPTRRSIVWLDLGQYHFYSGNYSRELATCFSVLSLDRSRPPERVVTDLAVLAVDGLWQDAIQPTGFIFHAGRCGSYLLARVLARSRADLVWGEAQPHNALLAQLNEHGCHPIAAELDNLTLFRHLVLAMGRQRLPTYQAHIIKFSSYQILCFDFIMRAFPSVPKLFLYRDPAAVLVSYLERPPTWERSRTQSMHNWLTGDPALHDPAADRLTYYTQCIAHFFGAALASDPQMLQVLNYNQLSAGNLPAILASFGVKPTAAQLAAMQAQFGYYSKDVQQWHPFVADEQEKAVQVSPAIAAQVEAHLQSLYAQLEARPRLARLVRE